jgi:hypothetical protein
VRRARSRRANKGRHTSQTPQNAMRYPPTQPASALPYTQNRESTNFEELQQTPRASQSIRSHRARRRHAICMSWLRSDKYGLRRIVATLITRVLRCSRSLLKFPFGDSKGRFSPSPSLQTFDYDAKSYRGESPFAGRGLSMHSRQSSMVFMEGAHGSQEGNSMDAGLWLEGTDYHSMNVT